MVDSDRNRFRPIPIGIDRNRPVHMLAELDDVEYRRDLAWVHPDEGPVMVDLAGFDVPRRQRKFGEGNRGAAFNAATRQAVHLLVERFDIEPFPDFSAK